MTSAASTAAFTLEASVASAMFCFCLIPWTPVVFALSGDLTTSTTFHCGMRPFSVLSGDAVVHHSRVRTHHEPGERR